MKRATKKDYIFIGTICAVFIAFVVIVTRSGYIWGSATDWEDQHIVLPDYFRKLFYETGDLFPSFAANIGGGQNIYNFAYYGLYNPIILLSYLVPFVPMKSYIICTTIISVLVSAALIYCYLRKTGKREETSLITALLFLFAGPVIYHSHQHIMFINYMPFLIAAFFATDRYIIKKKPALLVLFSFLIILTSFYYSIGSLICLIAFGVYRYIKIHKTAPISEIALHAFKTCLYMGLAILLSAFFLLPTALALLAGRGATDGSGAGALAGCLIPKLSFTALLYSPRSLGLTAIAAIALIGNFFSKKKHLIFLSAFFCTVLFIPAINYATNGFLYIDGKTFIPLLPLGLIMVGEYLRWFFLDRKIRPRVVVTFVFAALAGGATMLFADRMDYRFLILFAVDCAVTAAVLVLYTRFPKKRIVGAWLCLAALSTTLLVNFVFTDDFSETEYYEKYNSDDARILAQTAFSEDSGFYRLNEYYAALDALNRVYTAKHYQTTLYSSTYNSDYRRFYYDVMNNEISFRNASITNPTSNILFNMLTGSRYIIANSCPAAGYKEVARQGEYRLYRNDDVYSVGYLSDKLMPKSQFDKLSYPYTSEALMKYIVVDDDSLPEVDFEPEIKPYFAEVSGTEQNELFESWERNGEGFTVKSQRGGRLKIKLSGELSDILFIRINLNKSQSEYSGDRIITINGTKNKLTSLSSRYHNGNNVFDYVISANQPIDELNVWFSKGVYDIESIEMYSLPYSSLANISETHDCFSADMGSTEGDCICGSIEAEKDGVFNLTIPYDTGFTVKVDGKEREYFETDTAFIGFEMSRGTHEIEISYTSPGLKAGMAVSAGALIIYLVLIIYSALRKKRTVPDYTE